MAPRTIYANLADGLQPFSLWDASLADMGSLGVIPCTASGTNTLALTPIVAAQSPTPAYANNNQFCFVAAASSTGAVTVNVNALGARNLYRSDGVTRANAGDLVSGYFYEMAFGSTLNNGIGGFYLLSLAGTTSGSAFNVPTAATSGSGSATTGTISASSSSLTLAAAIDFANGQGIRINHAGAVFALNPPTLGSVTPTGTPGATTYAYTIASLNATGGVGQSIANVTTATGNAVLSSTNYNVISWTAATGTAPAGYAVYGRTAGTLVLLAIVNATTFSDVGNPAIAAPDWLPTAPQTSASLPSWLLTTISSGAGTTSLTLAAAATATATAQIVIHDDTASLQAWLTSAAATGNTAYLPPGSYQVTSTLTLSSRVKILGSGFQGDGGAGYAGLVPTQSSGFLATTIVCGIFNGFVTAITNLAIQIDDIGIVYPVQPVANVYAITIQAVAGAGNSNTGSGLRRIFILGHYYGVQMINALDFIVDSCRFMDGWGGGLIANAPNYPSYNQSKIVNNMFWGNGSQSAVTNAYQFHIQIQAGGDMTIANNKFNFGGPNTSAIALYGQAAGFQSMEPMLIVGNSIEGCQNGIAVSTANASFSTSFLVITGNEIWCANRAILVNTFGVANWFSGWTITGNILAVNGGASKTCVTIDNASIGVFSGNAFGMSGGGSTSTAIVLGANTTNCTIESNVYDPGYTTQVSNLGSGNTILTLINGTTLTGPAASGTVMTLGNTETVTGVKTFGSAGAVGRLKVAGTTSGSTVVDATATASGTLTLPAATDTLIGKATTDTLTNKTYDTAGAGNSFSINGLAATANTGTGAVVRAIAPSITGDLAVAGLIQTGGDARVTTQFDKTSSAVLANIPGLSVTVASGLTYGFKVGLFYTANAASGVQMSMGGTATATAIIFEGYITTPSGFSLAAKATSLGASLGSTPSTGDYMWMEGTITVNAGGTLTAQFAQNVSGGTASSVLVGSSMKVWKIA